ncbi:MAG: hypothetical protein OEW19_21690 [Acidobacteriota bacterium]|nr:hypothetical protein [Acidobacteriota bacterium]
MRPRTLVPGLLLALSLGALSAAAAADARARGDEAYARRAEGHDGVLALPGPISKAIAEYEQALADDARDLEARTGLLRALFYRGEYVLADPDAQLAVFERGQILGEEGITQLIAGTELNRRGGKDFDALIDHLRAQPRAPAVYYWAAVHWGLWGRHTGKLAAARQGVAGKIRDYALIVNALEPAFEDGGGHRMLGRLHAEAPRLPFVTGWIDRKVAISELEQARALSSDALTALYFAQALLDFDHSRRDEALALLRDLAARVPDQNHLVEELRAIKEARTLLENLSG